MNSIKNLANKGLFSDTVLYTFSIVLARGLSILIFPILVANMDDSVLVHYDWTLTNVMLAVTFCVFGVDSAAGRMLANKDVDRAQLRDSSFSIILPQTIITMIILYTYMKLSEVPITSWDLIIIFFLLLSSIIINQVTNSTKWL